MPYEYDKRTDSFKDETGVPKSRQKMEIELEQTRAQAKEHYKSREYYNTTNGSGQYDPNKAAEQAGYWKETTKRAREISKALKSK